jgi:hypothetical protein
MDPEYPLRCNKRYGIDLKQDELYTVFHLLFCKYRRKIIYEQDRLSQQYL